jgi:hypothetical protein
MVVLVACLVASMAIAIVRLATTPTEILGDGFHGLPTHRVDHSAAPMRRNPSLRNRPRVAR